MTFPEALTIILNDDDAAVYRTGWNGTKLGKTMMVRVQRPDEGSLNTEPYLYIAIFHDTLPKGYKRVPWLISQEDVFANDWVEIE